MADSTSTQKRQKKLPACDYCKAKRVICHSQQAGSCPRCLEKGIVCKTTPTGPRKRRTKAQLELDKVQSNARGNSSASSSTPSPDANSPGSSLVETSKGKLSILSHNLAEPGLDLPPSLVKELLQDFRMFPYFRHPLIRFVDLESSLNRCSWQLPALPSQHRVLAQCIIAVTARISLNEHIIGPGQQAPPDFSARDLEIRTTFLNCREYGHRREAICEQLRAEAVWVAHREGIMTMACVSNTLSLALLEFLEHRASGKGGSTYSAAYIHHLRDLSESNFYVDPGSQTKYSAFLMVDALSAVTTGKSIPFTRHDELLLCGEEPLPLEEVFSILTSNSPTPVPVFTVMRPLSLQTIRLARDISESLTGAYARRHPLNEAKLVYQLNTLNLLHSIVSIGVRQMERLENSASDQQLFHWARMCAYPLLHGWASLVYLIFEELKRRRQLFRVGGSSLSVVEEDGVPPNEGMESILQARLDMFYVQVRAMTSQAALEIAGSIKEVPMLSNLTHLNYSNLNNWARFLLEDADADLNLTQRVWGLQRLRGGLNLTGFSWVDRTGTIDAVDAFLVASTASAMQQQQQQLDVTSGSGSLIWAPSQYQ